MKAPTFSHSDTSQKRYEKDNSCDLVELLPSSKIKEWAGLKGYISRIYPDGIASDKQPYFEIRPIVLIGNKRYHIEDIGIVILPESGFRRLSDSIKKE